KLKDRGNIEDFRGISGEVRGIITLSRGITLNQSPQLSEHLSHIYHYTIPPHIFTLS
ncbi:hypothetical protein SAMN05216565_104139, partial [Litchfieldia salsa]